MMYGDISAGRKKRMQKAACVALLLSVCAGPIWGHGAYARTKAPDNQKASITVTGKGALPNAQISLSSGPSQKIVTKSDRDGNFTFSNLVYSSFSDLNFSLDIPSNGNGIVGNTPSNHLDISYHPKGSKAKITGSIGKSGMLTMSIDGASNPLVQVAGEGGEVSLQSRTKSSLSSGKSQIVASIVNVGEACCPRLIVPATPVLLTISSTPLAVQAAPAPQIKKPVGGQSTTQPDAPYVSPDNKAIKPVPNIIMPLKEEGDVPEQAPEKSPKKKIPYIVQGRVELDREIVSTHTVIAAQEFSEQDYEDTYVGGIQNMADEIRNATLNHVTALGAMIDARTLLDTLRSIQISTVQTMKDYAPSDSLCRFGTLSRSLALSEDVVDKNRLAISKIMFDRNNQQIHTVFGQPGSGAFNLLQDFKEKYCDEVDNNGFLKGYCEVATSTSDTFFNRDVDFTRVFDVPLTLDVDFTDPTQTATRQSLIALFRNLSYIPAYQDTGEEGFDPNSNLLTTQDARAINAARQVAGNTYGALIAEKVGVRTEATSGTTEATPYILEILTHLGVSDADARALVSNNPSYFAQMEVMTKKVFQNPAFYANLYDSAANIDRQRVAMKAIELQQDRDFLESLRRREILLSSLLSMKLRTEASRAKESGSMQSGKN